jgi:hypothetical protein
MPRTTREIVAVFDDAEQEQVALRILPGYRTHDVHVHEFPA